MTSDFLLEFFNPKFSGPAIELVSLPAQVTVQDVTLLLPYDLQETADHPCDPEFRMKQIFKLDEY